MAVFAVEGGSLFGQQMPSHWMIHLLVLAVFVSPADAGDADPKGADAAILDPIIVTAPTHPLDESLVRLRKMLGESAPCLGCDVKTNAGRGVAESAIRYVLLPAEPPQPTEHETMENYVRCLGRGQDLDYLCAP